MTRKLKIALYGGTFDPIHYGHIALALNALEQKGLDQIWFSPAWKSPFKAFQNTTEAHHRIKMLKLALEDLPAFHLLDREIRRSAPSYTIDAIKDIIEHPPISEPFDLHLLVGADAVTAFFDWHEPEEIVKLIPLLIGSRATAEIELNRYANPKLAKAIKEGLFKTPLLDISSTEIRQRLKEGKYCEHLLPLAVIEYARTHKLYIN